MKPTTVQPTSSIHAETTNHHKPSTPKPVCPPPLARASPRPTTSSSQALPPILAIHGDFLPPPASQSIQFHPSTPLAKDCQNPQPSYHTLTYRLSSEHLDAPSPSIAPALSSIPVRYAATQQRYSSSTLGSTTQPSHHPDDITGLPLNHHYRLPPSLTSVVSCPT